MVVVVDVGLVVAMGDIFALEGIRMVYFQSVVVAVVVAVVVVVVVALMEELVEMYSYQRESESYLYLSYFGELEALMIVRREKRRQEKRREVYTLENWIGKGIVSTKGIDNAHILSLTGHWTKCNLRSFPGLAFRIHIRGEFKCYFKIHMSPV